MLREEPEILVQIIAEMYNMKRYYIETSLPGDEGKYFRYIILTESKRKQYIEWFNRFDWETNNGGIYYYCFHEYHYTKDEVISMLTKEAKLITPEQERVLKKFCEGVRFDIFGRLIAQENGDEEDVMDDNPAHDTENYVAKGR